MQKPDYTMSIVQVFPGDTIPAGLLLKLHSENQSAMGLVVRDGNVLNIEKFDEMDSVEDEVKETAKILENTKKHHRMLCFSSFLAKFDTAEVQPWTVLKDSKGNALLVVACEGDFPGRSVDGHSEFYSLMHEYLGPKIEGLYKLLGNDMKKLIPYLQTAEFRADLDNVFAHRAVFEFLPNEGDPFTYGKNAIGGEFKWGRASNIYGYSESAQEAATPATAEPEKKRSKYANDTPDTALPDGVHRVPDKAPAPVTDPPKADPKPDPIATAAAAAVKGHHVTIPSNLHGKRKKAFIRNLLNDDLPPDWDNMTKVWVEHQGTVNSLADLSKTAVAPIDMKGDAPKPVPVISGKEQAEVVGWIKKFLDGQSNRIDNPLEIQKIESKLPVFTELAALPTGLDDVDSWSASIMAAFIKSHPDSAWLLMLEYRQDRRKRKQLQLLGEKKLSELTGTEVPTKDSGTTAPATATAGTASQSEFKKSKYA